MPSEGHDHDNRGRPAGPLAEPSTAGYRVRRRGLPRTRRHRIRAVLLTASAPALAGLLLLHVLWPTHWTGGGDGRRWMVLADSVTLVSVGLAELFALACAAAVAYAVRVAGDPVPVTPGPGTRLALLTTYAPGQEPLAAVRAALEGAVRVRHPGPLDVWLLDEGDDPEARMLCAELGVHHFTRLGVPEWNREAGPHRAGTRHGNVNAWLAKHGDAYDFVATAAPGHLPRPGPTERMTGYFRDPDVAFVVGPRARGQQASGSPRGLLHALVQTSGNRFGAPLLDGADMVVRVGALRQAGGLGADAAATGFEIHRLRNPLTGRYWRSVHTADVRAAAEAPRSPADASTRRPGRSRAEYAALLRLYGKALFRVPPGRLLGYTLTLARRPVEAVTCLFAVLSGVLVLTHPQARAWAVLALAASLAPLVPWSLARLRGRGGRPAPGPAGPPLPARETEPALAAASTPGPGD
ncbi:glycosyl transferase [Streptomyces sp. NPDC056796]|uniref:glycosyl transferase n=1 Tax=Streptomyces sp. NPDC056796 TaxID=3345947 RepID=UPI0036AE2C91